MDVRSSRSAAYSYLRFSDATQSVGDSQRRQLVLAEKYAAEHDLDLDRGLTFRDLGVSAFRGRNSQQGALRSFLDAIEGGFVSRGSFLLVESLDRLTRERILLAQGLFLQIIQCGITIVTLADGRSYSEETLNRNPLDLIISLVTMMRSNEESSMKSMRNRAAWEAKRAAAHERPMTGRCPGWLTLDKATGQFLVIEERADVVRRVYRATLDGVSQHAITRQLNREEVPLFGHGNQRGKHWHRAFVKHLQTTPTVVGTLIPMITDHVEGKLRLRPQEPVLGYYPAIVDEDIFQRVQAIRLESREKFANHRVKQKVTNLLAGLAKCPICGGPMICTSSGEQWRYLVCNRVLVGAGCVRRSVRYHFVEECVIAAIPQIVKVCPPKPLDPVTRISRLRSVSGRLKALAVERSEVLVHATTLTLRRSAVGSRIAEIDNDCEQLRRERRAISRRSASSFDPALRAKLAELQTSSLCPDDRVARMNSALRALLSHVVVSYEAGILELHWKHGGTSEVRYQR